MCELPSSIAQKQTHRIIQTKTPQHFENFTLFPETHAPQCVAGKCCQATAKAHQERRLPWILGLIHSCDHARKKTSRAVHEQDTPQRHSHLPANQGARRRCHNDHGHQ